MMMPPSASRPPHGIAADATFPGSGESPHPCCARDALAAWPLVRHTERDLVFRDRRALAGCVAGRHRVQRLVTALVVLIRLEEENHKRLLAFRIVKNDDLLGWHVLRPLAALHLALHLCHAFAADAIKGHDSCERHNGLLVESSTDSKPSRNRRDVPYDERR